MSASAPLARRAAAEAVGTAALVAVVVGSGIQASELTRDIGVQLLANSLATVFGLGVLIALLGPVSGAHFNPVVTLAAWFTGGRTADGLSTREVAAYVPAQIAGAIAGAVLADAMFARPLVRWSTHDRSAGHLLLAEAVATAGLVWLVFGLARAGRAHLAPVGVASYIGAAYWFTSSTSFANPAVTIGRAFTDTFAGIAPASVAPFLAAQFVGAGLGLVLVAVTFGRATPVTGTSVTGTPVTGTPVSGDEVVVPHGEQQLPPPAPPLARPAEESAVSS
ncbi:aquaporin [Streptomyces sp. NPDC006335]|uniref:aquaporin n=1 Tax=Streptomyces sp. NPDC006335 TaxID=3156895 RepID=UPI0033BBA437